MAQHLTRRGFLKQASAGLVTGPAIMAGATARGNQANDKIKHVTFGGGGMAMNDVSQLAKHPNFHLYAIVDVDKQKAAKMRKQFPQAKFYRDWRAFFEKEADQFDSCNVTIPDHMHAPVAMTALRHGKHVYCQKPLCHNLHEVRQLTEEAAARPDLVTQMGIQLHSRGMYQVAQKIIQNGDIGQVHTVHLWCDRDNHNGRSAPPPDTQASVPKHLNWDLWLGTAPHRPYVPDIYHPYNWRKWQDFGTGQIGDMGCHIFDPVVSGLKLSAPTSVRSEGPEPAYGAWPMKAALHYHFPATQYTDPNGLAFTWWDGNLKPPQSALSDLDGYQLPSEGSLWLGTKGTMLLPHFGQPRLFPREKFRDYEYPEAASANHWHQFLDACLGKDQTWAPFAYGGPLTEAVLVGSAAERFQNQTLRWDPAQCRFANHAKANDYLKRDYRKGWSVPGLG
jgi:hypothetical protein